jgi:hypothetical protein
MDIGQPYARDDFSPQLGTLDLASVQCTVHYSAGILKQSIKQYKTIYGG